MSAVQTEILDKIGSMTVLELSELIKAMEEKFNVSAAAAVAVAGPAAGAAPAAAAKPAAPASASAKPTPQVTAPPAKEKSASVPFNTVARSWR